ncbi:MAG: hypothetical protein M0C28_17200, partial [Candidatus Moduliflexus flocculans]|nr:hypothetical protein [Candidatus Moduliflexus flocculans]
SRVQLRIAKVNLVTGTQDSAPAYIVVGFVLFCFAAVSVRLVDIMLLSHETFLAKARGQQLEGDHPRAA